MRFKRRCELSPVAGLCIAPRPFNKVVQLAGTFFSPLREGQSLLRGVLFRSIQGILIRRPFDSTVRHCPLQLGSWLPTLINQLYVISTFSCAESAPETGFNVQKCTLPLDVFNPQVGCLLQDVIQTSPSTRHGCRFKLPSL